LILLDTHAILWAAEQTSDLGREAEALIDQASREDALFVSPISAWELAMLAEKGKLAFSEGVDAFVGDFFSRAGVSIAEITPTVAVAAGQLQNIHGDPADRLLVATARAFGLPLLTADRLILAYAAAGHVEAIDARR